MCGGGLSQAGVAGWALGGVSGQSRIVHSLRPEGLTRSQVMRGLGPKPPQPFEGVDLVAEEQASLWVGPVLRRPVAASFSTSEVAPASLARATPNGGDVAAATRV